MWIHFEGQGGVLFEARARSWDHAGALAGAMRAKPPAGYKILEAKISHEERGGVKRGGKRCIVTVEAFYVDDREPLLNLESAQTYFAPYEAMVQGREPFPPSEAAASQPEPSGESASA